MLSWWKCPLDLPENFYFYTVYLVRHTIPQRIITALLLPFVIVAMNGTGFAWLIYEWEWEDILTHHYQTLDPNDASNKAVGRAYICEILERNTAQDPTLPKPPVVVQELRSILTTLPTTLQARILTYTFFSTDTEGAPLLGFLRNVFRPPTLDWTISPVFSQTFFHAGVRTRVRTDTAQKRYSRILFTMKFSKPWNDYF